MENYKKVLTEIEALNERIGEFNKLSSLCYWDMKLTMPSRALEDRAKTLGFLSGEVFNLVTSEKVKEYIDYFSEGNYNLTDIEKATVRVLKKNYEEIKNLPREKFMEFSKVVSLGEAAWEEGKKKKDFSIFSPKLKEIVNYLIDFTQYFGYEDNKYDALLDQFEGGLTVRKTDELFNELKEGIIEILSKIREVGGITEGKVLQGNYPIDKQKELSNYLLDIMKYDKESGRIDETTHPFTLTIGNKDVRITTHYYEDNFLSSMYSVIHEGGHGLYEQHIPDELNNTGVASAASMGIHESQSRFYENIIGRSEEFLSYVHPYLVEHFQDMKDITVEDFYKEVNKVNPSLIRIEADELTYSLHIIIRYEIEKGLINGDFNVEDLPSIWERKYKEYLGVIPNNHEEGVLQDMHWSAGNIGYFPSYALGNLYGAQLLKVMEEENSNMWNEVKGGDLSYVNNWLNNNIHNQGAIYTPDILIKKITGEELKATYFVNYLKRKYGKLYNIKFS